MADPFKDRLGSGAVKRLAELLARPHWSPEGFVAQATQGLEALELKARVRHIATALHHHLDPHFPSAAAHVLDSLPPPLPDTDRVAEAFELWPLLDWVALAGLDHADVALPTLAELTRRFSAEFAIRPFLRRDPEGVLAVLHGWTAHPDVHVRRLVSEGTRPRLPWGGILRRFQADPTETLALLDKLKDDPELYVRRSVANHLADIAKDHPEQAIAVATRWMRDASEDRAWVVRHALRHPIKQGMPQALALLGFGSPEVVLESLVVTSALVTVGGDLLFEVVLRSQADQTLMIDYCVHHQGARGLNPPKVFKWVRRQVKRGEVLTLTRRHPMRPISTRTYVAGEHRVGLRINGVDLGMQAFQLRL